VGVTTLVRTPDGLVVAGALEVGDVLLSADIQGFPYEDLPGSTLAAINWSDKNPDIKTVETTVISIVKRTAPSGVMINNDLFSNTHYVLVKKGAKALFVLSTEVSMTDKVYNYNTSSWENVTVLQKADIPHEVVSINCEPYDVFYTERMLVHDSVDI
jgi:phage tail sheath protein FI